MKRFAVLVAVLALASFSAPALAMTNPFMDVPMNHWAYDAIGQLAAHGILAGYPDGTYKGQQQTTRYELASSLARALAVVDMTKASKQDVEMMKRLVVEFRDELEALGVRVDELDERVAVLEDRLGGWHIHGELRLDIKNVGAHTAPEPDSSIQFDRARLFFERRFGEAEEMKFVARLQQERDASTATLARFYAEMPFFFDSTLTVGKFLWEWETAYFIGGDTGLKDTGGFGGMDDILTDRTVTGIGWAKNFGLGRVQAYASHRSDSFNPKDIYDDDKYDDDKTSWSYGMWDLGLTGSFQFTERFGFDIGGVAWIGDNAEKQEQVTRSRAETEYAAKTGYAFNHIWTLFAGLRFNWNENIAFRGIFYHQDIDTEGVRNAIDWDITDPLKNTYSWYNLNEDADDPNHWAIIVDIAQPALTYTSLWLEYGQFDKGFIPLLGYGGGVVFADDAIMPSTLGADMKYWRVAAAQEWNETWSTHIFYYGYDLDEEGRDKMSELGLGVQYRLNPSTTMGLNYLHADNGEDGNDNQDDVVRFRTQVVF